MPLPGQTELDRFIERLMRRARIPGLSLGVSRFGRPVLSRGYGFRDRERQLPATPSTVFGIASMTKSFTALAILLLEEAGRLRLTDPVRRHLPEFRTPEPKWSSKITLHHLLCHTSGLPPLPSLWYAYSRSLLHDPAFDVAKARRVGIDLERPPIDSFEQLLEYLAAEKYHLLDAPGRCFSYSNEGFMLLGAVVERASGLAWEQYIDDRIVRPAGMTHTTCDPGVKFRLPELTTLYFSRRTARGSVLVASEEWWQSSCGRPEGGIVTSVDDFLAYLEIFRTGGRVGRERILSPTSVRKMLVPRVHVEGPIHYGYGIALRPDYHGDLVAFHGGSGKGIASEFMVIPRRGVTGVVLSNIAGAPSALALQAAVNLELKLPMRSVFFEPAAPSVLPRSLGGYKGWFADGYGTWIRVRPEQDCLRLAVWGVHGREPDVKVNPNGGDEFLLRFPASTWTLRFLRTTKGRIWGLYGAWVVCRRREGQDFARARQGLTVW